MKTWFRARNLSCLEMISCWKWVTQALIFSIMGNGLLYLGCKHLSLSCSHGAGLCASQWHCWSVVLQASIFLYWMDMPKLIPDSKSGMVSPKRCDYHGRFCSDSVFVFYYCKEIFSSQKKKKMRIIAPSSLGCGNEWVCIEYLD